MRAWVPCWGVGGEVRRVVRQLEGRSNHLARALAVILAGKSGKVKATTASLTVSQSNKANCRIEG